MLLRTPGFTIIKNTVIIFALIFLVLIIGYHFITGHADIGMFTVALGAACASICIIEFFFLNIYWHLFLFDIDARVVRLTRFILCFPIKKLEYPYDSISLDTRSEYMSSNHGGGTVWGA